MDELSTLIKEAKPLYYKNKARKEKIKKACLLLFVMFSVGLGAIGGYNLNSINSITSASITEESVVPVDEYGLITVTY